MERLVCGLMSGTSLDGIDAALVRISGRGLHLQARLLEHRHGSLGPAAQTLQRAAAQEPLTAAQFSEAAWQLGQQHARLVHQLLGNQQADLIVVHGQTVVHAPPHSWQLINPAPIGHACRCPVIADLRQGDLAAGGQGAPITPLADWLMYRSPQATRAVVNLGGFCNITTLPTSDHGSVRMISGLDVCVCNQLLDTIARESLGSRYDTNGEAAGRGICHQQAAQELITQLKQQRQENRSLGTGDEAAPWLSKWRSTLAGPDLAATAVTAIASVIAGEVNHRNIDQTVLAGGGTRNQTLHRALERALRSECTLTDTLGIPSEAREAMAMAVLGTLASDGVGITLEQVTGRSEAVRWNGVRTVCVG